MLPTIVRGPNRSSSVRNRSSVGKSTQSISSEFLEAIRSLEALESSINEISKDCLNWVQQYFTKLKQEYLTPKLQTLYKYAPPEKPTTTIFDHRNNIHGGMSANRNLRTAEETRKPLKDVSKDKKEVEKIIEKLKSKIEHFKNNLEQVTESTDNDTSSCGSFQDAQDENFVEDDEFADERLDNEDEESNEPEEVLRSIPVLDAALLKDKRRGAMDQRGKSAMNIDSEQTQMIESISLAQMKTNGFDEKHNYDEGTEIQKFTDSNTMVIYENIIRNCKMTETPYLDPDFPCEVSSLAHNLKTLPRSLNYTWVRADMNWNPSICLFDEKIKPNDIRQGKLGVCYYLACIAAMAERPYLITRLFHPLQYVPEGCYAVNICDSGEWRTILVDSMFAIDPTEEPVRLAYAKSAGNSMWISILEKALAKNFGSYQSLQAGSAVTAFRSLTNAPSEGFKIPQSEDSVPLLWNYLTCMLQNGYMMATQSKDRKLKDPMYYKRKGLLGSHVYTVLDAREVEVSQGVKEKLIKLRNPWGRFEWNGDWSEGSSKWTEDIKRQLPSDGKNGEGVFWMSLSDFQKYFKFFSTCKFHPNYIYNFIKIRQTRFAPLNASYIRMKVSKSTKGYLSVIQKEQRHFARKKTMKYSYSYTRVWLAKLDAEGEISQIVTTKFDAQHAIDIERIFEKGEYLLYVETSWNQGHHTELVVNTYAENEITLKEVPELKLEGKKILEDCIKAFVRQELTKAEKENNPLVQVEGYKECSEMVRMSSSGLAGIHFVYIQNKHKELMLKECIEMSAACKKKYQLPDSFKETAPGRLKYEVPPNSEKIVVYRLKSRGTQLQYRVVSEVPPPQQHTRKPSTKISK